MKKLSMTLVCLLICESVFADYRSDQKNLAIATGIAKGVNQALSNNNQYQNNEGKENYEDCYQAGFIEGYKISRPNSINPVPPIAPTPQIGRSSCHDGYKRGIIDGNKTSERE